MISLLCAASNVYLQAVRDAFIIFTLPLVLAGSLFLIVANPPIPALATLLEPYKNAILVPFNLSFGLMALFLAFGVAYSLAQYRRTEPVQPGILAMVLFLIAIVNLFTKPSATVAGTIFSLVMFGVFSVSERITHRNRGAAHVEMDQFNVAAQEDLSPQCVGVRPGNILVPVSNFHALYHLQAVLDRVKPERRDVVVLHIRLLRRSASGSSELEAEQLFGSVEQFLFTRALSLAEKRGKTIRLAVVAANDMWSGILNAAVKLESNTIVLGRSGKVTVAEQAREIGLAWEQIPDPRPQFNLEIFAPGGQREFFLLGPHAPNLTSNEVRLIHRLWLRFSDLVAPNELHHHDIVHFALDEVLNELKEGKEADVVARLKNHVERNKAAHDKPS